MIKVIWDYMDIFKDVGQILQLKNIESCQFECARVRD